MILIIFLFLRYRKKNNVSYNNDDDELGQISPSSSSLRHILGLNVIHENDENDEKNTKANTYSYTNTKQNNIHDTHTLTHTHNNNRFSNQSTINVDRDLGLISKTNTIINSEEDEEVKSNNSINEVTNSNTSSINDTNNHHQPIPISSSNSNTITTNTITTNSNNRFKNHNRTRSFVDQRLDPNIEKYKNDDGSITDQNDYSRKILQVINPDDTQSI